MSLKHIKLKTASLYTHPTEFNKTQLSSKEMCIGLANCMGKFTHLPTCHLGRNKHKDYEELELPPSMYESERKTTHPFLLRKHV